MKKLVLLLSLTLLSVNYCKAQEWFSSIDIAKRLALVQDKMLFVVWEASLNDTYPLLYTDENGDLIIIDLSKDTSLDAVIWDQFIPVKLPESNYDDMLNAAKGRGVDYIDKLNDDSIKIMDANKNILNIKPIFDGEQNLSILIKKYALKTTFLKQDLSNYSKRQNFNTSFNLASKYVDFAIFVDEDIRAEIIGLANIYFEEARNYLNKNDIDENVAYAQRVDLLILKEDLILNNPRKVRRLLKRIDNKEVAKVNQPLYVFLNYTTFKLLNNEKEASLWQAQLSEVDQKKAELIININK